MNDTPRFSKILLPTLPHLDVLAALFRLVGVEHGAVPDGIADKVDVAALRRALEGGACWQRDVLREA